MLNTALDISALAAAFAVKQRLVIRDILVPEAAEAIHRCFASETPWGFAYNDETGPKTFDAAQFAALKTEEIDALYARIAARAATQFQYRYRYYPILKAYLERRNPHLIFNRVVEVLNSPPVLDLVRRVTGALPIVRADAQATQFLPGDFLNQHTDADENVGRHIAYVMSFAKGWLPNWGGMLQFYTQTGDVDQGFLPRFNSLMLFKVPQDHAVTYVPAFAPAGRYSITGWFADSRDVPATTKAKYGL
jgi:SM-20-related protein